MSLPKDEDELVFSGPLDLGNTMTFQGSKESISPENSSLSQNGASLGSETAEGGPTEKSLENGRWL